MFMSYIVLLKYKNSNEKTKSFFNNTFQTYTNKKYQKKDFALSRLADPFLFF